MNVTIKQTITRHIPKFSRADVANFVSFIETDLKNSNFFYERVCEPLPALRIASVRVDIDNKFVSAQLRKSVFQGPSLGMKRNQQFKWFCPAHGLHTADTSKH